MDAEFWHDKWKKKEIGFNCETPHPLLTRYFNALNLGRGSRIFVPLCGKSVDMAWLLKEGYKIVGCELSEIAVREFFETLQLEPEILELVDLKVYRTKDIEIYVGNIFDVSEVFFDAERHNEIHGVYDRAAIVALPPDMRKRYTRHLARITNRAPQLVITFEYEQSQMQGPQFSVDGNEMHAHYDDAFTLERLMEIGVKGGIRAQVPAKEVVWAVRPKG
ncbi:MAG: Thiopurine S-methyltransferase [Turneriella sp.]|nr:Thiopurine S-methyltransferase [Turneriella sp.]